MEKSCFKLSFVSLAVLFLWVSSLSYAAVLEPGYSQSILADGLANPQDITFYHPGGTYGANLFVTEYNADRVTRINAAGVKETLAGGIQYAVAILFGSGAYGNHLYVSESYSSDGNIVRVLSDGTRIVFATGIDSPLDMVWGIGGAFGVDMFVASANANKIVKVSPGGRVTDFVTGLDRPSVLAFSPGGAFGDYLYVTNTDDGQIVRVAPDRSTEVFVSGLTRPIGLAFGHNTPFGDYLYVTDKTDGEILKISPSGEISTFANGLGGPVEVHFSTGGLYGNDMLIAEGGSGRITRITSLDVPVFDITPLSGDVGRAPFTFSFTLTVPKGLSTVTDFRFILNGTDVTAALIEYLAACVTYLDGTSLTVSLPGISLPPGLYTIELLVTDVFGHTASGKVTYSVP